MNELERELYGIVEAISRSDTPIIFKGAIITKLVLSENNYTEIERGTKDIDANWVNGKPLPENIADSVTKAMQDSGLDYNAVLYRPYGEHKSTGLHIYRNDSDELITKMDIDVKPLAEYSLYHYGEAEFYGASVDQILADKIAVLSSDRLFRRSKDLVDVFALSRCTKSTTNRIYDILKKSNKHLDDFNAFSNRTEELEHAYNLLRGVTNKPEFVELYKGLHDFIVPFRERQNNLIWLPDHTLWDDIEKHKDEIIRIYDKKYADVLFSGDKQEQKFICLAGIPGSGKQAKAKEIAADLSEAVIIRTNDIREAHPDYDCRQVFETAYDNIRSALNDGKSVIFIATNLDRASRKEVLDVANNRTDIKKELVVLYNSVNNVSSNEDRNILRNKAVKLHNYKPDKSEGWDVISSFGEDPYKDKGYIQETPTGKDDKSIDDWNL